MNGDCHIPNAAYSDFVAAYCVTSSLAPDARCYPACTSATDTTCTGNTSCQMFSDNTYGFCKPS